MTDAQARLLIHMAECGGWDHVDPVRAHPQVIDSLERKGLITVDRAHWGEPVSAILTDAGRREVGPYVVTDAIAALQGVTAG